MTAIVRRCASVFGLCVICASLFSGCASTVAQRPKMDLDALDSMVLDCNHKAQQIAFLQSLRPAPDDRLFTVDGWFGYNDRLTQIINHQLRYLANYC